jgi:hypothetical protein
VADLVLVDNDSGDTPRRLPRAIGRSPLTTLDQVAREQALLYRSVASGKVSPTVGSKLTFMLSQLVRTLEVSRLEPAIERLEQQRQSFGS